MRNKIVLTVLLIFVITTLSGCVTGPKEVTTSEGKVKIEEGGTGPDWCKKGTKITASGPQGQGSFEIKGITTYKEKEVCEAEYIYDQGSMVQYFNEDSSYMVMVYKDKDGKVTQEINVANPNP